MKLYMFPGSLAHRQIYGEAPGYRKRASLKRLANRTGRRALARELANEIRDVAFSCEDPLGVDIEGVELDIPDAAVVDGVFVMFDDPFDAAEAREQLTAGAERVGAYPLARVSDEVLSLFAERGQVPARPKYAPVYDIL